MDNTTDIPTAFIPDESAAPDPGRLPSHYGKIHNIAGDAETSEHFRKYASTQVVRYTEQEAGTSSCGTAGPWTWPTACTASA